jgi:hypothetical protein
MPSDRSAAARKARLEKERSMLSYLSRKALLVCGNDRWAASIRSEPGGKWKRRLFLTQEEAKAFAAKWEESVKAGNPMQLRTEAEASRENGKKAQIALIPIYEERRKKLSFLQRTVRKDRVYFNAYVRGQAGGKWKRKWCHSEEEAQKWIDLCLTAIRKRQQIEENKNKREAENEVKSEFDLEYLKSTSKAFTLGRGAPSRAYIKKPVLPIEEDESLLLKDFEEAARSERAAL